MVWKIFKKYSKNLVKGIIGIFIITIVLNYVRSLIPLFISKVFNIVNAEGSASTLPNFLESIFTGKDAKTQVLLVMICIIATGVIRDSLNLVDDIVIGRVSENFGYTLQLDFFDSVQKLPFSYLNHCETGDLIQRSTNDINRVKRFFGDQIPELLNDILKIIIYFGQIFIIDWQLGLIVFAFVPIIIAAAYIYHKKMRPTFNKYEEDDGALSTVVQENLTGIRVVKAFANEDLEIKKERAAMSRLTGTWKKMMDHQSSYWAIGDIFSYGMMILAFTVGIIFINKGQLTIDALLAIVLLIENVMDPTRQVGRLIGEFGRTNIAAQRLLEVTEMQSEYEIANGSLKPKINGNIEFKNVSFKFSDATFPTLNNISFNVKEGETIALIGKTGCGKSTLVSLLNRMLEVSSGDILFDGVSIKDIDKQYLRKNVGLVLQESFLFSTTIEENIKITNSSADISDVKKVAEIAAVDADIERFEKKYDTVVGERGVTLSGGQKQRISIARMLLEKKPILVFDDSLSAVDTETDLKIRNAISNKENKSTTFIITHRVITAKDADKIIVMEDGKISNIGTHDELIHQDGLYKKIWDIQSSLEREAK